MFHEVYDTDSPVGEHWPLNIYIEMILHEWSFHLNFDKQALFSVLLIGYTTGNG